MNTQVEYSKGFVRQFKKLTPEIKKQAIKAETLFKRDPFSPKLKTNLCSTKLLV